MSVIVKICGLSTADTLEAAVTAGADMVGFVFFPASPRHLDIDFADALGRQVRSRAAKVALTVDADDDLLDAIVEQLRPDWFQFHGNESPDRLRAILELHGRVALLGTHSDLGIPTGDGYAPMRKYVSMKFTPDAEIFTRTCPAAACGCGKSP